MHFQYLFHFIYSSFIFLVTKIATLNLNSQRPPFQMFNKLLLLLMKALFIDPKSTLVKDLPLRKDY